MNIIVRVTFGLLSLVLLQGCGGHREPGRDFIERQAYSEEFELVSAARSESGKTEIHYRLESDEADKNVFIRLDAGDIRSLPGSSGQKGLSTTLRFPEEEERYELDPRYLFDNAVEMYGNLFPIKKFQQPSG